MDAIYRIPEANFVRAREALDIRAFKTLDVLRTDTIGRQFDAKLVDRLIDEVIERGGDAPAKTDGWFASRVHAVLRFPRRVAADQGMWFWLAAGPFRRYVEWRFPKHEEEDDAKASGEKSRTRWWRYDGGLLRNAVARLWWGAEMLRDGSDYGLVETGFRSVRTFMFVSELRYSRFREAARAFARVCSGDSGNGELNDEEVQELSVLFNVYLRLDILEARHATSGALSSEWDESWGERIAPSWAELTSPEMAVLVGPAAGFASRDREEAIVAWLTKLVAEAKVRVATKLRGKARKAADAPESTEASV